MNFVCIFEIYDFLNFQAYQMINFERNLYVFIFLDLLRTLFFQDLITIMNTWPLILFKINLIAALLLTDRGRYAISQIHYQFKWYISCNSIQCQTVKYMNKTLINQLKTPKFYKDSVYHTIRNQVKKNKQSKYSQKILIVTGKRSIGKSTSIKEIANQLMSNGTPVFFLSLQGNQKEIAASNIFKNRILNNEMFNLLKHWRLIQSYSRYADRFNQLFNYTFPNQIPVLIIDEINTVSQLCQKQCPQIVQLFFKSLIFLRKRGASVILLSSDPNFLYLQKISGVRTMQDFNIIQAHVKPKQDFNEMFKQYKIQGIKKKQILKYYGQREPIIILFKVINAKYGKINLKNIKKYTTSQLNQITQQLYAIQAFQQQERNEKIRQVLMKICKQQYISIGSFYYKYLEKYHVVFKRQFKQKIIMKAFESFVKKYFNETIKCKEAKAQYQ